MFSFSVLLKINPKKAPHPEVRLGQRLKLGVLFDGHGRFHRNLEDDTETKKGATRSFAHDTGFPMLQIPGAVKENGGARSGQLDDSPD